MLFVFGVCVRESMIKKSARCCVRMGRETHAVQFSEFAGPILPIVCGPLEVTRWEVASAAPTQNDPGF